MSEQRPDVETVTEPGGNTLEVYLAGDGWRWRLKAPNHAIIGSSSEAFHDPPEAWANAGRVLKALVALDAHGVFRSPVLDAQARTDQEPSE